MFCLSVDMIFASVRDTTNERGSLGHGAKNFKKIAADSNRQANGLMTWTKRKSHPKSSA
jgi:hypothetical protein